MNLLRNPKNKLLAASAALGVLLVMASMHGASAPGMARLTLAGVAFSGIGWWWIRAQRAPPAKFQLAPRLSVVSRAGLSQRAGLALVEVDGRSFLVVHGDGYAEICVTAPQPKPTHGPRATDSLCPRVELPEGAR